MLNLLTGKLDNNKIQIFSWNCRSLLSKLSCFKVRLYCLKPHVACLSETWLKSSREPKFINYNCIWRHRPGRQQGGGLAFLVRNDVHTIPKQLNIYANGFLEVQALTIIAENNIKIDLLNIYNPNAIVTANEFIFYFQQMGPNTVIVGDFNCHHRMWDTRGPNNSSGLNLADALLQIPSITLLTPPSLPTYYNIRTNNFSTLDLCFVSSHLYPASKIELERDIGSDHYPVITFLSVKPSITKFKARQRWLFDASGSWELFQSGLKKPNISENLIDNLNNFTSNILNSSAGCFKQSKETVSPRYCKPWWSEKCNELIKQKHSAKLKLNKHPTTVNLIAYKKAEAMVKHEVKVAKKQSWVKYCSEITSFTPISLVWNKIGRLKNSYTHQTYPIITDNNILTNTTDKANKIADYYEKVLNTPPPNTNSLFMLLPLSLALCDDSEMPYNSTFTLQELSNHLAKLKHTSPGEDMIHNKHLSHLPESYELWLLTIINQSFLSSTVPRNWRSAIIIPINKPGKSPTSPASYRPVSLLSCVAKVMEKLICSRLYYYLEINCSFSNTQGGFRKRLSTVDQLARLELTVRNTLVNRGICVCVFFDLSSAFDCVWHLALLYKLAACGIKGRLLKWIAAYLEDRDFKVLLDGEYSSVRNISSGVPQGAILSPVLFNVMLSDLPTTLGVAASEYADDITIYATGNDINTVTANIQRAVDNLYAFTTKWGLSLNYSKTKCMIFTRKHIQPLPVKINNVNIDFVEQHKFLGIILDSPGLVWKPHIQYLKDSSISRINLIKAISNNHWGADREILLRLYGSLVLSRLDYGAILYDTASKNNLDKLNIIQNHCLRIASGARKTTPIISLEIECNIKPLSLHRKELICRYYCKILQFSRSLPVVEELLLTYHCRDKPWCGSILPPPVIIRAQNIMVELEIPPFQRIFTHLMSPVPPWCDINNFFHTEFINASVKEIDSAQSNQIFKELINSKYKGYLTIYTDGSKVHNPRVSTAASVVIPSLDVTLNWRLSPLITVLGSELFAIKQALLYIKENMANLTTNIVILTDSMSSVYLLLDRSPKNYMFIVHEVQNLVIELNSAHYVMIQYLPAHKDIAGNELADTAAKEAHKNNYIFDAPLSKEEMVSHVKKGLFSMWEQHWDSELNTTNKGRHLKSIRDHIGYWPWTSHKIRVVETVMARLRLGHIGLNQHLNRFQMRDSNLCTCGQVESIEHFLLDCVNYQTDRNTLKQKLQSIGINFTIKDILGGGPHSSSVQKNIVNHVANYLLSTNKLWDL
jgi:ribonuclease HI